ncbi:hypothetical protein EXIGLDRAFT_828639 [Exidia glandulosa HHB12029]|uniref:STE3-domain-containing protein n=1 Tax=Exidia glandulosa HHB12029 TaxID=1314781 RepID=A0A165Q9D5_EXIGL|nr:hypothetical protein EXIGLDRAFT_828639 [Exidia glandulosa HHB12029]
MASPTFGTNASLPATMGQPILPPGVSTSSILVLPVTYLVISSVLGAFMVPLLIALFLFSTRELRRSTIFVLNVISVLLGIAQAIFNARNDIRSILNPFIPEATATFVSSAVLIALGPILVDSILLLRLVAVYPYTRTPKLRWFLLMAFPVACKVFRVVNISMFSHKVQVAVANDTAVEGANLIETFPQIKMEWIAQLLDNTYMSTVFIHRLYRHHRQSHALRSTPHAKQSFSSVLVDLMWIATFNFVFPDILNLAQLIVCYVHKDFTTATYISQANFHVTIIGVVLATVWVSATKWADKHMPRDLSGSEGLVSSLRFTRPTRQETEWSETTGKGSTVVGTPRNGVFAVSVRSEQCRYESKVRSGSDVEELELDDKV